jgi:hypothetical protein
MVFNAPPNNMLGITPPDAARTSRSGGPAGWPEQGYWFVYWSSVQPHNAPGDKGTRLQALRDWFARSLMPSRAHEQRPEIFANLALGEPCARPEC